MKNIFLVGGTGRSGTTILNKILGKHPELTDVPEWRFLIDPDGIIDFYIGMDNWSPYHMDKNIRRLKKLLDAVTYNNFFDKVVFRINNFDFVKKLPYKLSPMYASISSRQTVPLFEKYKKELISELSQVIFDGYWEGSEFLHKNEMRVVQYNQKEQVKGILLKFLNNIMSDVLVSQNANYYLEKNTWNILWYDKILEFYPDAKMVHIYRDPRDVVASYTKQTWMPSDPEKSALIYKNLIQKWSDVKAKIPVSSYYECSLEELVTNSETTIKKICDFYEIPFEKKMLNLDLSKSNSGRWKNEFSTSQQNMINDILQEEIKGFGYES